MKIATKILQNQNGFTAIMAVLLLLGTFVIGAGLVGLTANGNQGSVNEMQGNQAFYVGHAGLEQAKYNLSLGQNPSVTNQPFGGGSYTITTSPNQGLVTVTSTVGKAKKTQAITANFAQQCVALTTNSATTNNNNSKQILGVKIDKSCNASETLTSAVIDWNWDPCVLSGYYSSSNTLSSCPKTTNGALVTRLSITGNTVYDPSIGVGTPTPNGAGAGVTIDTSDLVLTQNSNYTFNHIEFSQAIPNGALFTIGLNFADGSQLSSTFQIKNAPSFSVKAGALTVEPNHNGTLKALCSLITYGAGGPTIPVTTRLKVNGSWQSLFNGKAIKGNEVYNFKTDSDPTTYLVEGFAKYSSFQATYDSSNTKQVMTLLNNDTPPPLAGFGGQKSVSQCVSPYLDKTTGKVKLNGNQAIVLFELGVDMTYNQNSPAADFQDLVMLWNVN